MSHSIEEFRSKMASEYNKIRESGEYVGYIQMSDKRIEHVFKKPQKLPEIDSLYVDDKNKKSDVNYILEMALFDSKTNNSILVRQHNADFLMLEKVLTDIQIANADSFYTVTPDTPKMKIVQIWKEEENEFCLNMEVLEPKCLMFAGFEEAQLKGDKL